LGDRSILTSALPEKVDCCLCSGGEALLFLRCPAGEGPGMAGGTNGWAKEALCCSLLALRVSPPKPQHLGLVTLAAAGSRHGVRRLKGSPAEGGGEAADRGGAGVPNGVDDA
jgi:hypothetical protein